MATQIYEVLELKLQNGDVVEVKPLNIKRLRKFMALVGKFENVDSEDENIDLMVDAVAIALETAAPKLVADREALEDALDVPTIWKILEVAGGVTRPDPNLVAAAMARPGTT